MFWGEVVITVTNCRMNLLLSMNQYALSSQMLTYFLENTALLGHKIMNLSNPLSNQCPLPAHLLKCPLENNS